MDAATRPDPEIITRLLERLEPFSTHPGTLQIHDPLYFMLSEPGPVHIANLTAALRAFPDHPLTPELLSVFGEAVDAGELTLEAVLVEDGPIPADVDPIREVKRRFDRARDVRRILEERIEGLEAVHDRMVTTTNAMTSLSAIMAVFALLGWLAALGVWEIPWLDPQHIEPPEEPEEESAEGDG